MQNVLLILAVSGLDVCVMQVSITLQCETYLQVNKQDSCRVIKGHLIKIRIPGLIQFWILWGLIILNQQTKSFKKLQHIFVWLIYAKEVCTRFHISASSSNPNDFYTICESVECIFPLQEVMAGGLQDGLAPGIPTLCDRLLYCVYVGLYV